MGVKLGETDAENHGETDLGSKRNYPVPVNL